MSKRKIPATVTGPGRGYGRAVRPLTDAEIAEMDRKRAAAPASLPARVDMRAIPTTAEVNSMTQAERDVRFADTARYGTAFRGGNRGNVSVPSQQVQNIGQVFEPDPITGRTAAPAAGVQAPVPAAGVQPNTDYLKRPQAPAPAAGVQAPTESKLPRVNGQEVTRTNTPVQHLPDGSTVVEVQYNGQIPNSSPPGFYPKGLPAADVQPNADYLKRPQVTTGNEAPSPWASRSFTQGVSENFGQVADLARSFRAGFNSPSNFDLVHSTEPVSAPPPPPGKIFDMGPILNKYEPPKTPFSLTGNGVTNNSVINSGLRAAGVPQSAIDSAPPDSPEVRRSLVQSSPVDQWQNLGDYGNTPAYYPEGVKANLYGRNTWNSQLGERVYEAAGVGLANPNPDPNNPDSVINQGQPMNAAQAGVRQQYNLGNDAGAANLAGRAAEIRSHYPKSNATAPGSSVLRELEKVRRARTEAMAQAQRDGLNTNARKNVAATYDAAEKGLLEQQQTDTYGEIGRANSQNDADRNRVYEATGQAAAAQAGQQNVIDAVRVQLDAAKFDQANKDTQQKLIDDQIAGMSSVAGKDENENVIYTPDPLMASRIRAMGATADNLAGLRGDEVAQQIATAKSFANIAIKLQGDDGFRVATPEDLGGAQINLSEEAIAEFKKQKIDVGGLESGTVRLRELFPGFGSKNITPYGNILGILFQYKTQVKGANNDPILLEDLITGSDVTAADWYKLFNPYDPERKRVGQ